MAKILTPLFDMLWSGASKKRIMFGGASGGLARSDGGVLSKHDGCRNDELPVFLEILEFSENVEGGCL